MLDRFPPTGLGRPNSGAVRVQEGNIVGTVDPLASPGAHRRTGVSAHIGRPGRRRRRGAIAPGSPVAILVSSSSSLTYLLFLQQAN